MTKVYTADVTPLEEESLFRSLYAGIPLQRQEKIDSLRFQKDRQLSLGAWLLLEAALRDWGYEDALPIDRNPHGKPFLKNCPGLHFNLSHSGSRVLCALSDGEVGCDIQQMGEMNLQLARRFFSPEEVAALTARKEESRREYFYRLWALKESFVKAVGLGLALPLQEFSVLLSEKEIRLEQSRFPDRQFFFREWDAGEGYACACCAETPEMEGLIPLKLW